MKFTKKSLFIYLLVFNLLILFGLFTYLFKIENHIKHYNTYKKNISNLILIEREFKHFFLLKDQFINFDTIVNETKEFESNLNALYSSNLEKDFGSDIIKELNLTKSTYEKKLLLIEDYKSIQASILNSLHYLLDLNKTIKNMILNLEMELMILFF